MVKCFKADEKFILRELSTVMENGGSDFKFRNLADMHTHSIHSFDGNDSCLSLCTAAADKGACVIAVTDHCDIDGADIDVDALCTSQLDDLEKCQAALKGRIRIIKGIEIGQGIYRKEETLRLLDTYAYDFVLGSVHNLENEDDFYFLDYSQLDVNEVLGRYFDAVLELCKFGAFDSLAHLTYPLRYLARDGIDTDMSAFSDVTDEILSLLVQKDKALEINTSGLFMEIGDTLPDISYIRRFKELGGKYVTVGSDSHYAEKVCSGIEAGYAAALESGFDCVTVFSEREPMLIPIVNL